MFIPYISTKTQWVTDLTATTYKCESAKQTLIISLSGDNKAGHNKG